MRNTMKLLLIAMLCLSLLAVVGCSKGGPAPVEPATDTTTVPTDTTGETQEETTTEKPVNLLEDPLNNGEGDPTDAMENTDPTKEDDKPGVDIEVDEDESTGGNGGNTGNTGNTGNSGNSGNTGNGGNSGNSGNSGNDSDEEDDFVIDFDELN